MIKDEKQRFVIIIEQDTLRKFKELAIRDKRSASNLAVKVILDYIEANY